MLDVALALSALFLLPCEQCLSQSLFLRLRALRVLHYIPAMGIKIPAALHAAITEADQRVGDIDEIELAELLNATLGPHASLSLEERKGAFAEVGALYFIPVRDRARSAWDMYWQPLSTGITADGIEYHSPDVSLADDRSHRALGSKGAV